MGDGLFDIEGPEKAPLGKWRLEQRNPHLGVYREETSLV